MASFDVDAKFDEMLDEIFKDEELWKELDARAAEYCK